MTYNDPQPLLRVATVEQRQRHTLALVEDAARAVRRLRMEGCFMTDVLRNAAADSAHVFESALHPNSAAGIGLHVTPE